MIKNKILLSILCSFTLIPSITSACGQADPITSPTFCASFKAVAKCHCPFTPEMCEDMEALYQQMVDLTGSLEDACNMQSDTSPQNCIDDWNCYRKGGKDSKGNLCSGTGKKCG